jgi:hypothetical protein
MYALLELAERVEDYGLDALSVVTDLVETPDNEIRGVDRFIEGPTETSGSSTRISGTTTSTACHAPGSIGSSCRRVTIQHICRRHTLSSLTSRATPTSA